MTVYIKISHKLTSHIIGMIRVQKKEGRMPYVRLVITNPGQITDEYRPWRTENLSLSQLSGTAGHVSGEQRERSVTVLLPGDLSLFTAG